ncbi:MAG TPA: hypothetical protein VK524_27715 [Polyangiaceae bacterium]|nr:hypothetical protein [Polyangiaceae bacterium]
MNPYFRRFARISLASSLLLAALFPACAKRGEGDRCDATNAGNDDCENGLVCIAASDLDGVTDRCCPPEGSQGSCLFRTGGTGGNGGTTGDDAAAGTGGSAGGAGGPSCQYTSDCVLGQVCGPRGTCQAECRTDRDCTSGGVCSAGACVDASAGTGGDAGSGGTSGNGGSAGDDGSAGQLDEGGTG